MSRIVGPSITILNAANNNIAAANSTWYKIEGADQVLFDIQITGTANAHLDWDYHNNNTATASNEYTSNNQFVHDDPMGQVRAWADGMNAGEAIVVKMRKIFQSNR